MKCIDLIPYYWETWFSYPIQYYYRNVPGNAFCTFVKFFKFAVFFKIQYTSNEKLTALY